MYLTADGRQQERLSRPAERILVIDDETALLEMLQLVVTTFGYEVVTAQSVDEAERLLTREGTHAYACVLTDYKMPGKTGLELLRWLRQFDPNLSIIVNTGYASHDDVLAMIREGAVDILQKPVQMAVLGQALNRGVRQTRQRRYHSKAEQAVKQVGLVQGYMLRIMGIRDKGWVQYCSRPVHQAGGDFVSVQQRPDGSYLLILADVAGHNLDAAYISAFFHGAVHGMSRGNFPPREIMADINTFLHDKWNDRDLGESVGAAPEASVCALFMEVWPDQGLMTVHNNGIPPPLLTTLAGESRLMGEGNCPLGLYDDPETSQEAANSPDGASLLCWSDGLESYALAQRVTPEAAACRLLSTPEDEREELLLDADDDIMVLRLCLASETCDGFHPIIIARYSGNQAATIDEISDSWARSLHFAVETLTGDQLYPLLLTARELLLNALIHGCGRAADKAAELQIHHSARDQLIRLKVSDPGPGHSDNFLTDPDPDMTKDRHSGLVLIRNFPDRVWTNDNNATVYADFRLR